MRAPLGIKSQPAPQQPLREGCQTWRYSRGRADSSWGGRAGPPDRSQSLTLRVLSRRKPRQALRKCDFLVADRGAHLPSQPFTP